MAYVLLISQRGKCFKINVDYVFATGQRHGHEERHAGGGGAVPPVAAGPDQPDRAVPEGRVRSDCLAAERRLVLHQVSLLNDEWTMDVKTFPSLISSSFQGAFQQRRSREERDALSQIGRLSRG